jgi:hypothetical protein
MGKITRLLLRAPAEITWTRGSAAECARLRSFGEESEFPPVARFFEGVA